MNRIDRRAYLALVAGGTIAGAGCFSREDDEPTEAPENEERSAAETRDESEREAESNDDESQSNDDESRSTFAIGDLLEVGELEAVVADTETSGDVLIEAGGEVLEAEEGDAFAVVDVALRHAGDEPVVDVSDAVTVALVGADGEAHDRVEELDRPELDPTEGRLAPGEVARGDLVYAVEDDADGLAFELESPSDEGSFTVDLETKRDESDRESLEQELTDVHGFSEGVEHDGIEITVASLEHGNNLGGFMQSDEGYEIVAVGVTIENRSGRDRTLSPAQAQLKDESGRIHGDAPGVVRALEGFDGTTLPDGEDHEAKIAYQIEEGLAELFWAFDFGEWGEDERVFWQLR